jgi:hypothetical protein
MSRKVFTLVEVTASAFIVGIVLTFLAMVLWVSDQTYLVNMGLVDLHAQARRVMDGMTRELRKSKYADIQIPSGSYAAPSIQFVIPKNVTIIGNNAQVNYDTVHYYLSNSDHTIRRVIPGSNMIIASNIDSNGLQFCWSDGASACPCTSGCGSFETVRIEMRGNQTMRGGSLLFNTTEQVRLRND